MITEKDLQEAIAECQGQKYPTTNTCIKLAAFLTIKNLLYPDNSNVPIYSYAKAPVQEYDIISYDGNTEFAEAIKGKRSEDVWKIIDELMSAISVLQPKLYNSVMSKL